MKALLKQQPRNQAGDLTLPGVRQFALPLSANLFLKISAHGHRVSSALNRRSAVPFNRTEPKG